MKKPTLPTIFKNLKRVKEACVGLRLVDSKKKNEVLRSLANLLTQNSKKILMANERDLKVNTHQPPAYIDRLRLNIERIDAMSESLRKVAELDDPVGEEVDEKTLKNGLKLKRVRASLGVIFMIFESRPNVAIEAFSMAFKSGNAIILRGGKESKFSVAVIYGLIQAALRGADIDKNCLLGITDYDRKIVDQLLLQKDYIDIVIPRGGEKLIAHVQANSLMPVIKNDRGLCHVYVHEDADIEMAKKIVINAKTSRPSVCNALETLLVHQKVAARFLPILVDAMQAFEMKYYVCKKSFRILKGSAKSKSAKLAKEENYNTEYLDFKLNIKVVSGLEEAIKHIEKFGSKHSEAILTKNEKIARLFQAQVDAAVVYWNASTRFTDGFEMGLGGEIGISTQKLHVRGPVGLRELTSIRWVVDGTGQIR